MRRSLVVLLVAAGFAAIPVAAQPPQPRDLDNAAAFARLYGVVRYFYPSDAGASLAWNRFAVHGVRLVRAARTTTELERSLKALFAPLGPGIEIGRTLPPAPAPGTPDKTLIAWRYLGAGMDAATQGTQGPYQGKRTNRANQAPPVVDGSVVMLQTVPALPLRGKTIRLRGFVRAAAGGAGGGASLWLRVDRPNQQLGFFDNMMDRQVRDPSWREYTIEGPVADDAANVAFGTLATGTLTADFDGINLEIKDASGAWTPVAIQDGGFEASPDGGWIRGGNSKTAGVSRPGGQAAEGERFLHIEGAASLAITAEVFDADPPAPGAHVDVELGAGLKARVRLALTDAEARGGATASASIDALKTALDAIGDSPEQPDIDTRAADVVVAWNVFRHFYPYWTEAGVDWNTRLRPQLEIAAAAKSRNAQRDALRLLVADARDGHGGVNDRRRRVAAGWLPIALEVREKRVVIVASRAPNDAPVGAVVTTIDGVPADTRLADLMKLSSGTSQWRERRALAEMIGCQPGAAPVTLALETGAGARASTLACDTKTPPLEKRPDPVSELSAGVWYVDLSRARMNDITPVLAKLAAAKGVVFDLRGYPTDAGFPILAHLLVSSEQDRWMHVARLTGPFGQNAGWESVGWDQTPKSPRLSGRIVFLTDGRAISYAESVMGYVRDRKLATIVGATTAGTNGNVISFEVPSGFAISFTGMKVTRHDGRSAFHLLGVEPVIPVSPTIAGLRSDRDEVLERGLAVIEDKQR